MNTVVAANGAALSPDAAREAVAAKLRAALGLYASIPGLSESERRQAAQMVDSLVRFVERKTRS